LFSWRSRVFGTGIVEYGVMIQMEIVRMRKKRRDFGGTIPPERHQAPSEYREYGTSPHDPVCEHQFNKSTHITVKS
jgi:hypothetical protein